VHIFCIKQGLKSIVIGSRRRHRAIELADSERELPQKALRFKAGITSRREPMYCICLLTGTGTCLIVRVLSHYSYILSIIMTTSSYLSPLFRSRVTPPLQDRKFFAAWPRFEKHFRCDSKQKAGFKDKRVHSFHWQDHDPQSI
jgi:hypothetical protein